MKTHVHKKTHQINTITQINTIKNKQKASIKSRAVSASQTLRRGSHDWKHEAEAFIVQIAGPQTVQALNVSLSMWAPSTWKARMSLLRRIRSRGPLTPQKVVDCLAALPVSHQTKLTYAKGMAAILGLLGVSTLPIRIFIKGLRAMGASIPIHQATPITRSQVTTIMSVLPQRPAAAVWLAWATSSRWTEAAAVSRSMLIECCPNRVIINWGQRTKSTRLNPFTPSQYVVMEGAVAARVYRVMKSLSMREPLTTWSSDRLNRVMKRVLGNGYSTHSIKRGAVTTLLRAVAAGRIPIEMVSRLAKHASLQSTLRYAEGNSATALALGTQRVTALLE
eukprot:PhM_4_TR14103/c3_g1_i2/m.95358